MRTRTLIAVATVAGMAGAIVEHNLAAMYVALSAGGVFYMLHAIEVKINKLLDHHRITVGDGEIARD
jgi:xanthine/uracil permease